MLRVMAIMVLTAGSALIGSARDPSMGQAAPAAAGLEAPAAQPQRPDAPRERGARPIRPAAEMPLRADSQRDLRRHRWTDQEVGRALEILRQIDAGRAEPLIRLRRDNPAAFERAFAARGHLLKGLIDLEKRDPNLFELRVNELRLEAKARRLAARVHAMRTTDDQSAAAELENDLRRTISHQVDYGLRARALELVLLEQHIKSLREQLQVDAANQQRLVERQVQELLTRQDLEGDSEPIARDKAALQAVPIGEDE